MEVRSTRRGLLAAGSGGFIALAGERLLGPASAFAAADAEEEILLGPSVTGTLQQVESPDRLVFGEFQLDLAAQPELVDGALVVGVTPETILYRGSKVELQAFQPGDKLIAYVKETGDGLVAIAVEPTYESVEATVVAKEGTTLDTTGGTVVVDDDTIFVAAAAGALSAPSVTAIEPGFRIFATCRVDPSSGDYIAANIAARR